LFLNRTPPHPPRIPCGIFCHSLSRAWRSLEKGDIAVFLILGSRCTRLKCAHLACFSPKLLILYIKLRACYLSNWARYLQLWACCVFFCASLFSASTPFIYRYLFEKKENKRERVGVYKYSLTGRVKYISKFLLGAVESCGRTIPRTLFKVNNLLIQSLKFLNMPMGACAAANMPPPPIVCEKVSVVHVDFGWCL